MLNQMSLKEVCVHSEVFIASPYQSSLWSLYDAWRLNAEVDKDLDASAEFLDWYVLLTMGFLDTHHDTLDEPFPVLPEHLRFECKEGGFGCVDFGQSADAVSIHVVECSLDQFDKESVILPRLCEHHDEIAFLGPWREWGNSGKDVISEKSGVRFD